MSRKTLVLTLAFTIACGLAARAEDVYFTVNGTVFDYTENNPPSDQYNDQPGTISGELLGLNPNGTSFPTLIVIDTQPDIFDLPENFPIDPSVPSTNQGTTTLLGDGFTLVGGKVTADNAGFSYQPSGYGGMQAAADLDFGTTIYADDSEYPGPSFTASGANITFTPLAVVSVPEPSQFVLAIEGVALLLGCRRLLAKKQSL